MNRIGSNDREVAQVISRRSLTAEVQVSPRGISGGQNDTKTGFSQSSSAFACQYNSTVTLHTHISSVT
jgi:hypothetical protein